MLLMACWQAAGVCTIASKEDGGLIRRWHVAALVGRCDAEAGCNEQALQGIRGPAASSHRGVHERNGRMCHLQQQAMCHTAGWS